MKERYDDDFIGLLFTKGSWPWAVYVLARNFLTIGGGIALVQRLLQ